MVTFPGVFAEESGPRWAPIVPAPTAVTAFIGHTPTGPLHQAEPVHSWAAFEQRFGGLAAGGSLARAVHQYFLNGGAQALVVRLPPGAVSPTAWVPSLRTARQRRQGLYALDAVDGFNLLCLPPPAPGQDHGLPTWARAAAYCRERRALLLLDAPTAWISAATTAQGLVALRAAVGPLAASHVAVLHPRLRVSDPQHPGTVVDCAPCGAVAGVIARTDAQRGVWHAPIGAPASIAGVLGLNQALTQADCERLEAQGVNALRSVAGTGPRLTGACTLAGTDGQSAAWRDLPVRRLALHIENSVLRVAQLVAFEANDERLWVRVTATVQDFLASLWRQGALLGTTPEEAFFVRCDRSTMSAADRHAGRLRLLIGLAPRQPAEFVQLRLTLQTAAS